MTIPRVVKVYAKTVAVFVAGWVFNVLVDLVKGEKPWPQTKEEWFQYLLTSFGVALVALVTKNKIIQKQIDNDPNVIGGFVIDDPANANRNVDHRGVVTPDTPNVPAPPNFPNPGGTSGNLWE